MISASQRTKWDPAPDAIINFVDSVDLGKFRSGEIRSEPGTE